MRQRTFDLLAIAGIFAAYTVTIRLALGLDAVGCLLGGVANTVPVVIFGTVVRRIVARQLIGKPAAIQLAAHLVLCFAFAALSYWLLIVLLGLFNGQGPGGFVVRPFSAGGTAWQSLENVTTYALIAAVSHLQAAHRPAITMSQAAPAAGEAVDEIIDRDVPEATERAAAAPDAFQPHIGSRAETGISRYFVRIGEELRPLDLDAVVSIGGADDYAEVRTLTGTHLVRVTLTEFARSLDPTKYVRVHRSWIVNTLRIARAEPAGGGRLLLHMETGQTISTSRDGARLLRHRII